jgi:hypothetical protein
VERQQRPTITFLPLPLQLLPGDVEVVPGVPERFTTCGLLGAVLVSVSVPASDPVAFG